MDYLLYIYIYILLGSRTSLTVFLCSFLCGIHTKKLQRKTGDDLEHKARAITSGETPQKSLILPPVHTFINGPVAPLNSIFNYFYRISGG